MPEIAVRIKNIADIKRAFSMAPTLMAKELNIAIREAVLTIGRRSRINTPVDTGRLRSSTYEQFTNLKGEIGTKVEYDIFVHEGTRFMAGRPYLRRAVEASDADTQRFFEGAVQRTLDYYVTER